MKDKSENNSFFSDGESQVKSRLVSSRLSYAQALEKAKGQIDLVYFRETDKPLAAEILANIAEVFMLWDATPVKIAGVQIDGYILKQIFEQLHEEHVQLVIDNFHKIDYIVNYKKAYIRTALYNSVFEIEAHYDNLVKHDLGL